MSAISLSLWATGLVVTASGLDREAKQQVQASVETGGGRYSPSLTSDVTHVVLKPGSDSQKLNAIRSNRKLWPQEVVTEAWLELCKRNGRLEDVGPFRALPQVAKAPHDALAHPANVPAPAGRQPLVTQQHRQPASSAEQQRAAHPPSGVSGTLIQPDPPLAPAAAPAVSAQTPWVLHHARAARAPFAGAAAPLPLAMWQHAIKQEQDYDSDGTLGVGWLEPTRAQAPADAEAIAEATAPPVPPSAQHKPAPWRVHFSQVEDDPLLGALAGALGPAPAQPWRMQVHTLPEGDEAADDSGPQRSMQPHGSDDDSGGDAGSEVDGEDFQAENRLSRAPGAVPAPHAAQHRAAWRVQHDGSLPDVALPLPAGAAAAGGVRPRAMVLAPWQDSQDTAVSGSNAGPAESEAWSAPGAAGARPREKQQLQHPQGHLADQGWHACDPRCERHAAAGALLQALASPPSSQGSFGASLSTGVLQRPDRAAAPIPWHAAAAAFAPLGAGALPTQQPAPRVGPPLDARVQQHNHLDTDGDEWLPDVPLTQLVEGLREARQGLGHGHSKQEAAAAAAGEDFDHHPVQPPPPRPNVPTPDTSPMRRARVPSSDASLAGGEQRASPGGSASGRGALADGGLSHSQLLQELRVRRLAGSSPMMSPPASPPPATTGAAAALGRQQCEHQPWSAQAPADGAVPCWEAYPGSPTAARGAGGTAQEQEQQVLGGAPAGEQGGALGACQAAQQPGSPEESLSQLVAALQQHKLGGPPAPSRDAAGADTPWRGADEPAEAAAARSAAERQGVEEQDPSQFLGAQQRLNFSRFGRAERDPSPGNRGLGPEQDASGADDPGELSFSQLITALEKQRIMRVQEQPQQQQQRQPERPCHDHQQQHAQHEPPAPPPGVGSSGSELELPRLHPSSQHDDRGGPQGAGSLWRDHGDASMDIAGLGPAMAGQPARHREAAGHPSLQLQLQPPVPVQRLGDGDAAVAAADERPPVPCAVSRPGAGLQAAADGHGVRGMLAFADGYSHSQLVSEMLMLKAEQPQPSGTGLHAPLQPAPALGAHAAEGSALPQAVDAAAHAHASAQSPLLLAGAAAANGNGGSELWEGLGAAAVGFQFCRAAAGPGLGQPGTLWLPQPLPPQPTLPMGGPASMSPAALADADAAADTSGGSGVLTRGLLSLLQQQQQARQRAAASGSPPNDSAPHGSNSTAPPAPDHLHQGAAQAGGDTPQQLHNAAEAWVRRNADWDALDPAGDAAAGPRPAAAAAARPAHAPVMAALSPGVEDLVQQLQRLKQEQQQQGNAAGHLRNGERHQAAPLQHRSALPAASASASTVLEMNLHEDAQQQGAVGNPAEAAAALVSRAAAVRLPPDAGGQEAGAGAGAVVRGSSPNASWRGQAAQQAGQGQRAAGWQAAAAAAWGQETLRATHLGAQQQQQAHTQQHHRHDAGNATTPAPSVLLSCFGPVPVSAHAQALLYAAGHTPRAWDAAARSPGGGGSAGHTVWQRSGADLQGLQQQAAAACGKPAARTASMRTPALLASQGRRKRAVQRDTPAAMRHPLHHASPGARAVPYDVLFGPAPASPNRTAGGACALGAAASTPAAAAAVPCRPGGTATATPGGLIPATPAPGLSDSDGEGMDWLLPSGRSSARQPGHDAGAGVPSEHHHRSAGVPQPLLETGQEEEEEEARPYGRCSPPPRLDWQAGGMGEGEEAEGDGRSIGGDHVMGCDDGGLDPGLDLQLILQPEGGGAAPWAASRGPETAPPAAAVAGITLHAGGSTAAACPAGAAAAGPHGEARGRVGGLAAHDAPAPAPAQGSGSAGPPASCSPTACVAGGATNADDANAARRSSSCQGTVTGAAPAGSAVDVDASSQEAVQQEQQQLQLQQRASGGVLWGMPAALDPALEDGEEAARCAEALARSGARVVQGGAHAALGLKIPPVVVSAPEHAAQWLGRCAAVVSPEWLLRNLDASAGASGDGCGLIRLSEDIAAAIARQMRAVAPAAPEAEAAAHVGALAAQAGTAAAPHANGGGDPWVSAAQRRQFLLQIKAAESAASLGLAGLNCPAWASGSVASCATVQAPLVLLDHLMWSVTEPASAAMVAPSQGDGDGTEHGLGAGPAGGYGAMMTQADAPPTPMRDAAEGEPRPVTAEELNHVLFKGPCLTLLLPQDQHGVLGHRSITLTPAPPCARCAAAASAAAAAASAITVGQILAAVSGHYAQPLTGAEVAAAMAADPRLRRALQVAWQRMEEVARWRLLGPRLAFDGLRRCSWDHALAVYTLQLVG